MLSRGCGGVASSIFGFWPSIRACGGFAKFEIFRNLVISAWRIHPFRWTVRLRKAFKMKNLQPYCSRVPLGVYFPMLRMYTNETGSFLDALRAKNHYYHYGKSKENVIFAHSLISVHPIRISNADWFRYWVRVFFLFARITILA